MSRIPLSTDLFREPCVKKKKNATIVSGPIIQMVLISFNHSGHHLISAVGFFLFGIPLRRWIWFGNSLWAINKPFPSRKKQVLKSILIVLRYSLLFFSSSSRLFIIPPDIFVLPTVGDLVDSEAAAAKSSSYFFCLIGVGVWRS